ncbi:MAG: tetratricopeptide repeat protein, partial [Planctomycetales bacterium]|nr:tetratricopeptide repeat protein [Planctomycetales bacterium]
VEAFEAALQDEQLEVREEALINLSWCLFSEAREAEPNSAVQRSGLEKARGRLNEFLKSYGDSGYLDQALFYLGEIEYSLGNLKRSIAYYKKLLETEALRKSSLRPGALYALAVAYEEGQQEREAMRSFRQFLDEYSTHRLRGEVSVRLADLLLKHDQPEPATELLRGLVQEENAAMGDYALLRLGYALSSQDKSDEADEYYTRLLEKYPNSQHANTAALSLGQSLFHGGQYARAIEQFARVLPAQDSQAAEAAHWMAITWLREGKAQEALKLLEEALPWSQQLPNAVNLQMDYADALYALPGRLEEAREAYERLATEHEDSPLAPRAAYNAAFAALQGGKIPEARQWAEHFLQHYPQDPLRNDVAAVAAEAVLQQGEHEAAAQAYAKLRQVDPKNPAVDQWTLRQGMALYLAGDYPAAIELLTPQAGRLASAAQQAEAEFILGASYLYQEQPQTAIEHLTASQQRSDQWPSADEVLLMLAEAHQRNKDNASARKVLLQLLDKYPKSRLKAQVDYKLAQLSAALKEYDRAIEEYEAIVHRQDAASYHNFATYGIVWCLMQKEEYAQALERLQPLLKQGLGDSIAAEAKLAEGICLRKIGEVPQAIEALEAFLESKPSGTSLANGLYEVGMAYGQQGEVQLANERLRRIVDEVPSYPALDKVLYELAWNHQETSDPQAAAKLFAQLAEQFPHSEYSAEASYMLAQQQYEAEQYAQAAAGYQSVLSRTEDPELLEKTQYKLGWSLFQQQRYPQAATQFATQAEEFPNGPLAVDALFMNAECSFKEEHYDEALPGYQAAREALESSTTSAASEQVKSLIYLHGAQCYRELEQWDACEAWLSVITRDYPKSPYLWTAVYELGYCKQKQDQANEALKFYGQVVENNRNEIGARARFMMGEVYFSQRDFRRAIEEFTRVAYGFGGEKAPQGIKNWQAKSAYEAARCSEVLIKDLGGNAREQIIKTALDFYSFIVEKHAAHDLAAQAQNRLGELRKLR